MVIWLVGLLFIVARELWQIFRIVSTFFLSSAIFQADENILIIFHDLAQDLEAVVKPDLLRDLTSLNLGKHFFVFGGVHDRERVRFFLRCVNFYFSRSEEKYSAACSACHSYMACVAAS